LIKISPIYVSHTASSKMSYEKGSLKVLQFADVEHLVDRTHARTREKAKEEKCKNELCPKCQRNLFYGHMVLCPDVYWLGIRDYQQPPISVQQKAQEMVSKVSSLNDDVLKQKEYEKIWEMDPSNEDASVLLAEILMKKFIFKTVFFVLYVTQYLNPKSKKVEEMIKVAIDYYHRFQNSEFARDDEGEL
jgi:hypothetical protein